MIKIIKTKNESLQGLGNYAKDQINLVSHSEKESFSNT